MTTSPDGPTRLVLVRHGESMVMEHGIVGGLKSCTGLSTRGRRQAEALRARWEESAEVRGATQLYASTYPRAIETGQIVASTVGHGNLDLQIDAGFCELDPGDADGMKWEQAEKMFHLYGAQFDPYVPWAPGAETWAAFCHRAVDALVRCADRHPGETIVIACHGGVVDAAFRGLLRLPVSGEFDLWTLNASISEFRQPMTRRWALARYNDHAHLVGDLLSH